MEENNLSEFILDGHGNLSKRKHYEKAEMFKILADSIPENTPIIDVLYGGLLFMADIIHQMDPNNSKNILELSKGILDCEYDIMQKNYNSLSNNQ